MRSTPLKNTNPFNKDFLRQQLITYITGTIKDIADSYFSLFSNLGNPADNSAFSYIYTLNGSLVKARVNCISEAPSGDGGQISATIILEHSDGSICEAVVKNSQFFFGSPNHGINVIQDFALFVKQMQTDADALISLPAPYVLTPKV